MTDRPIIFSAPMVRALLDRRKTQTRRVLKPQPNPTLPIAEICQYSNEDLTWVARSGFDGSICGRVSVPYAPGDRLWVREAWYEPTFGLTRMIYAADKPGDLQSVYKKRPSIHMPRWASRLTLLVTDVRVQRVQEISEADIRAEGLCDVPVLQIARRDSFRRIWDTLNAKRGFGWDANPWVAALTFAVHKGNIDD